MSEKLWELHVLRHLEQEIDKDRRSEAAIELVRKLIRATLIEKDETLKLGLFSQIFAVWQLIVTDIFEKFDEVFESVFGLAGKSSQLTAPRAHLHVMLKLSDMGILPTGRHAVDPVSLILPRQVFLQLREAIVALGEGEVQPIVEPFGCGRHQAPSSWDAARVASCRHVEFLFGLGQSKLAARQRVGSLLGVGEETLRSWERKIRKTGNYSSEELKLAYEAGRTVAEGNIPDRQTKIFDHAYLIEAIESLSGESLKIFAAHYRLNFGKRHNQTF